MIILLLLVLAVLFGFGAVFAFTAKVLIIGIILGLFTLVAVSMILRYVTRGKGR